MHATAKRPGEVTMSKTTLPLLLLLAVSSAPMGAADTGRFTIVVHTSRPSTLTRQQVADIFMKRALRWGDGIPVTPFDLSVADPTRQQFSRSMLGQSTAAIVYYWQRQMFATNALSPPLVKSADDVLSAVGSTAGGIGYVSEGTVLPEGVKPVTLVENAK
jgi:ABC-type phosphate transport system substrate-binding protein